MKTGNRTETSWIVLASHVVVFRGLVSLPLWGGGNTSPIKTTAWEARIRLFTVPLFLRGILETGTLRRSCRHFGSLDTLTQEGDSCIEAYQSRESHGKVGRL